MTMIEKRYILLPYKDLKKNANKKQQQKLKRTAM
jgi:hypothetical protein